MVFIIESDLDNEPELHDAHNSYRLSHKRRDFQVEMMSDTQVQFSRQDARTLAGKNFQLSEMPCPRRIMLLTTASSSSN